MLKTLLIDDEEHCLKRLNVLLTHYCPKTVEVVGQCQTIETALAAIDTQKPDLLLMDVELDKQRNMNCFSLLNGVSGINFDIIFVTGHEEYALRAFQVDAIDFLLKPVDADKLVRAIGKVLARSSKDRVEHQGQLTQAINNRDRSIARIGIPTENGRTFIDVKDVVYCKSDGGYTKFLGAKERGKENLLGMASDPLTKFEEALAGSNFCRIHDSHIINMTYLKSYINGRGGQVEMTDGTFLNVSEGRKAEFKRRIQSGIF